MYNDYSAFAGLGIGIFIFGIVLYLAVLALVLWIGYLLMRTAVKNGVLLAMRQSGQQFPPTYRPPQQGGPTYPGAPGA
ncbi:hypothetical protein AB1K54_09645 [Microbacterium sp. BWT-B31]|uniref:hypothetical protein n=1 Tax=Microbacterium sp. BWT-B31 TaxID=3232072 RepID=UPI003528E54A